ncbi:MAG: hypothetical protein U1F34_01250 [Gammaproteobacteria bacterium]
MYLVEPLRNPYVAVFAMTFLGDAGMPPQQPENRPAVVISRERNAELLYQPSCRTIGEVQQLNAGLEQRVVESNRSAGTIGHQRSAGQVCSTSPWMMKMLDAWFELCKCR